ncbi:M28 family metallopeptidase [Lysobacter sp. M2-1]|uniref:M28 family metallopeptidase n=1 Tax=Lysobacter sp. M2-1 TaxID=2916839 RepID=UPI001F584ED0|nr:M28 family metallopeptidase [Lysobacter sp. M2-1]
MKRLIPGALCALCVAAAVAAAAPDQGIDADALSRHVRILASDEFEGRAPATPGEEKTVAYLIDALTRAGVQPGGENGEWVQPVPLVRAQVDGPVTARLTVGGESQALVNGDDVVLQTLQPVQQVEVERAPLVFVGYGVDAPERGWDDYKGVDLRDKVAVVLVNDPDFESGAGDFDGRGMTYYGRWTYKYEELARKGALGVLIVHETAPAAYGWATVRASGLSPVFDIERSDAQRHHTHLRGWMQRDLAVSLFKRVGLDFDAEKTKAQRRDFKPLPLGDASLSARFAVKRERVVSRNVIGKLEGAKYPQESVIYSAHWDAFGVGEPDAQGDRIRHGAIDNATGVASVLELARALAAGPRPQRSVLFIAFSAEEKGLLGATHYAAHPLMSLETTAAVINMEMFSANGPMRDIASWGNGRVSLEGDLERVAKAHGRAYLHDPSPESGFFYRADHFPFARAGVPAITAGAGEDLVDGGTSKGKALIKEYFADCYHQPCDRWTQAWNAEGHAQDTRLLLALGKEIANGHAWPQWQAGSEFKAARDASARARE